MRLRLFIYFLCETRFYVAAVAFLMGLVHSSRDPQTYFFNKTFIKNRSHDTIHIFKNYFIIVFLVFNF